MEDDATCEVVETSDTEERELLDARQPGYHQKVWGNPSDASMEIDGEKGLVPMSLFAPHEYRTSQTWRLLHLSNIDSSSVFSSSQPSPKRLQHLLSTTLTPATTPFRMTSSPETRARDLESAIPLSSPLGTTNMAMVEIKSDVSSERVLMESANPSQEPFFLACPLSPRVNGVAVQAYSSKDIKRNGHELPLSPTYDASSTHSVISNWKHHDSVAISLRSPSPPLEFPQSPSPDPLHLLPPLSPNISESLELVPICNRSIGEASNIEQVPRELPVDIIPDTRHESHSKFNNFQDHFSFTLRSPCPSPALKSFTSTEFTQKEREISLKSPSLSLTPPPSVQAPPRGVSPTLSSSLSPVPFSPGVDSPLPPSSLPIITNPDPNLLVRPYSLRNRSALQLNPFGCERRMYKHQLRGMPEAIVKDIAVEGRRTRERYRRVEEDWGDQSDGHGGELGDDDWERRKREREKGREEKQRKHIDTPMRELGIAMSAGNEGEETLHVFGAEGNGAGEDSGKRGKKRKRRLKLREFPVAMETLSSNPQTDPQSDPLSQPSLIDFRRRACRQPSLESVASELAQDLSTQLLPEHPERDFNVDAHNEEAIELGSSIQVPDTPEKLSSGHMDDVDAGLESTGERVWSIYACENEDSEVQLLEDTTVVEEPRGNCMTSSEDGSSEIEMTSKDRKRLKAIRRMMPTTHIQKLLNEEQRKSKKKKRWIHDADRREDDIPPRPGHGRKRIVSPGSKDPKRYEIRGDPESGSDRETDDNRFPHQEIIELTDSDDDGSDATSRSLEEIEDRLHAGHAGYGPDRDTLPSAPRMSRPENQPDRLRGEDLIDRMLQRTSRGSRGPKPAIKHRAKGLRDRNARRTSHIPRDARRPGAGGWRKTKLAFTKAKKEQSPPCSAGHGDSSVGQHQLHRVESHPVVKEKGKPKSRAMRTGLYVFNGNGRKVTSGRDRQIIHIDHNDDAFHEALEPTGLDERERPKPQIRNERQKNIKDILNKFRAANACEEPNAFDGLPTGCQRHNHVTLDFDIPLILSGKTFGSDSYMGKGRFALLISILNDEIEAPRPRSLTVFELDIDPDISASQFSTMLATVCDHLYDASVAAVDDPEMQLKMKSSEITMFTISQLVSFRAWCANDENGRIAAAVAEQTAHLVGRINERLKVISADGHILDPRSFELYWFAMELELRVVFARRKRTNPELEQTAVSTAAAERYAVQLVCRLLEYGLDRTLRPLQDHTPLDIASPDVRTMQLWACFFHLARFFGDPVDGVPSSSRQFWRIVEMAMDKQSNKPDSSLDTSERFWRTIFSLCAISHFSEHGLTTWAIRLDQNWSMVLKALGCIRLRANEHLDHSTSASALEKRDTYLRLVTGRCLLLETRYSWRLCDADVVLRELCAIFRSRKFANLLGEVSDFPTFIRDRDERLLRDRADDDTAYGLFLKMIIHALKDTHEVDTATRTRKVSKLLGMAVPVGPTSFTKASPPTSQELSMLFNRYSAIIVAIYVEPTPGNIHNRLQQVRRYITFKVADHDSQVASIRAMMNLAIILRHLNQPLDNVLAWASEMMNDLIDNYNAAETEPRSQLATSIQLLFGSVRMIIENPTLNGSQSGPFPVKYPDLALLREDWITQITSSPSLNNNQLTGIEIRRCIQSFLNARSKVIPPPPIPTPANGPESQDEYCDADLDMNDPMILALLDSFEGQTDENYGADVKVSKIMNEISVRQIYGLVCNHLLKDFDSRLPGNYFVECDLWIECWLGCASVAVRHKARDWSFYIRLAQVTCESIKSNASCRRRVYIRFMLTMLQLDPMSYNTNEDKFLEAWFESIVSPEVTIEHEFNTRLFAIGALGHVLFRNLPCPMDVSTGMVAFDRNEFEQLRPSLIDVVIDNVAEHFKDAGHVSFIEKMLRVLRENLQCMEDDASREKYIEFRALVHASVRKHPNLVGVLPPTDF